MLTFAEDHGEGKACGVSKHRHHFKKHLERLVKAEIKVAPTGF